MFTKEQINLINQQGIKEHIMLVNGLSLRRDFTEELSSTLGQELTPTEQRCYLRIHQATLEEKPLTAKQIYEAVVEPNKRNFGQKVPIDKKYAQCYIYTLISRIRSKLGMEAIIDGTSPSGFGYYLTRRGVIERRGWESYLHDSKLQIINHTPSLTAK